MQLLTAYAAYSAGKQKIVLGLLVVDAIAIGYALKAALQFFGSVA